MEPTVANPKNSNELVLGAVNSVLRSTKTSLDWVLFVEIIVLLVILFLAFSPADLSAQPDPSLSSATTDCGPRNSSFRVNWSVPFTGSLESGKLRYGPCFGGGPRCNDLGGACIQTEAERQEATGMLLALTAGTCTPQRGTLFPSEQTLYDWTIALSGTRSALDLLRSKYRALGCSSSGSGTVSPGPGSGSTGQTTCPPGQACRQPCPSCPVCPQAPTTTLPTLVSSGLPSALASVDVWALPLKTRYPDVRYLGEGVFLLRSGAVLQDCDPIVNPQTSPCVYAWQTIPSAPEASK